MAKRQIDSEDSLKRQARRRLIGAVALVTAVVIILPMILDREPRSTGHDIDLRIPDKNKAGAFSSQMVLPEEKKPAPASEVPAKPGTTAAPKPPTTKQASTKPVKPKPKAVHKPKPKPAPAKPESKPAPAKTAELKATESKGGFAVQVGAFAIADSARELQQKLLKQGLHAYTEKGDNVVRVRVGNYPTREAAEEVLHKLEAQGMHPTVVNVP
jgi:DedD protein